MCSFKCVPSVELGQQAFPHQKLYVVLAFSAYPSVSIGMYCNATYCNPVVVVLKKFSCRRLLSEWTMDILERNLTNFGDDSDKDLQGNSYRPEETQSVQQVYQNAQCGGPGSSCGSGLTDRYSASTRIGCRFRSSWESMPSVRLGLAPGNASTVL